MSAEPRRSQTRHTHGNNGSPYQQQPRDASSPRGAKEASPPSNRGRRSTSKATAQPATAPTTGSTASFASKVVYNGPLFAGYIPFAATPPPATLATLTLSAFSQLFKSQQQLIDASPLLRDFPLLNISQTLTFFSRKTRDTREAFGFYHGDRLVYQKGVRRAMVTTVVGARGGKLWVLDDDLDFPRALPENGIEALQAAYDFATFEPRKNLRPAAIPAELTPEVLNFLRQAPELFLTLANDASTTVFLSPTYNTAGLGTVGWVGEDLVTVSGGGVDGLAANATASIVVPAHVATTSIRVAAQQVAPEEVAAASLNAE